MRVSPVSPCWAMRMNTGSYVSWDTATSWVFGPIRIQYTGVPSTTSSPRTSARPDSSASR